MEILKILRQNGQELYPEDLDFFVTELDTGGYSEDYIDACKKLIAEIRNWQKQKNPKAEGRGAVPTNVILAKDQLVPNDGAVREPKQRTESDVLKELATLRNAASYKTLFKQRLSQDSMIDEGFIDRHIAFFMPWELEAIVMTLPLSEAFLDKYFSVLDADKVARYQLFSERFFIKHYAQFSAETVLTKSKNEWRRKENRSSQLDVFLRLKGVKI